MGFFDGLAENIIASVISVPIIAFLSFLLGRILRNLFRGKFYSALFSTLGTKNNMFIERYRLQHYIKHSFILENSKTDAESFSYNQFIKKIKTAKYVILTGSAGIGKSKLMQRLALQFRSHTQKGTKGDTLKNYGILFYKLTRCENVDKIIERIERDIGSSDLSYTVFLDGLDEMRNLNNDGDEILKTLIRRLDGVSCCKQIFISLRPEILKQGYSFSGIIPEAETITFKIQNFNERQILAMYRNENRRSKSENGEKLKKIPSKIRRENLKKLKSVIANNPNSVFTYPLILTWANEILSDYTYNELKNISWYTALDKVIKEELKREYLLYCTINNLDYSDELCVRFITDGRSFLKEIALKMALSNKLQVTKSDALDGEIAKRLKKEYGEMTLIARYLLRYIEWSEKEGGAYYEFWHNAIYWHSLAEALLDQNTSQENRAKIILSEAKNNFSTPLLQYCRQGLWVVYGGDCFPAYKNIELDYMRAIAQKSIKCTSTGNGVPLEIVLTCCYGFDEVIFDYLIRFDSVKIKEFVRDRKLNLSFVNLADLSILNCFGNDSFDVLDCSLSQVENAVIPNYVKEVNFKQCPALRSVTFPGDSRLSKIGERAFEQCSFLTTITIPDSVTSIEEYAFAICPVLSDIKLSNKLNEIKECAFWQCAALKSLTIPNSVTSIGERAFAECTALSDIKLSNKLTSIEKATFWKCTALKSLTIPNSVTSIGEYAFAICPALRSVTFPNDSRLSKIGKRAFDQCSSLTAITIPDSVTNIGEYAFHECTALSEIKLSNKLIAIEKATFWQCASLKNISIPNSVIIIGEAAFAECTALSDIKLSNKLNTIEKATFWQCTSLKNISIPNSVTSIGESAFWKCAVLSEINLSNKLNTIGKTTFWRCTSLKNITIPNSVTSIGEGAFMECTSLKSITIPNSVTIIEDGAFLHCTSLKSITIPNSVTSIEGATFKNCTSLKSITIPNSVTTIGDGAFLHCTSLKSITIPNSLMRIGGQSFVNCSSLEQIIYNGTVEDWNKIEKTTPATTKSAGLFSALFASIHYENTIEKTGLFGGSNIAEIVCKDGTVKID